MQLSPPFADAFIRYQPPTEATAPRATQAPLPQSRAVPVVAQLQRPHPLRGGRGGDRRRQRATRTASTNPAARNHPPKSRKTIACWPCTRCAARASAMPCTTCWNWPSPARSGPTQRQLLYGQLDRAGDQGQRPCAGRGAGTRRPDDRPRAPGRPRRWPAAGRPAARRSASSSSNSSSRCSRCRWRGCGGSAPPTATPTRCRPASTRPR